MSKEKIKFTEPHLLSGYSPDASILVALSGGADSSALLHLLVDHSRRAGCKLYAAHVNHGIRGAEYGFEADRDEKFCRTLCSSLGVELFVKALDVPKLARSSGRSLETEAREARYAFFSEIMRERGIKILATAHNADDNLETQLFNLCRGCGIDGMIGIPESRPMDGVEGGIVIRPLIRAEKRDIIAYCEQNGIAFVTDSTNLETDCTRNAIRHNALPVLCEIFPHAKKSAQGLSFSAREDSDFIFCAANDYLDEHPRLEVKKLCKLHPAMLKRVLILSFEKISSATLERIHLDALLSLLNNPKNGAAISLPDKRQATVTDGILSFHEEQRTASVEAIQYSQELVFGFNPIGTTDFAVVLTPIGAEMPQVPDSYALYASAKLAIEQKNALFAKNRSHGATVTDGGVNKRIKKLMCDKKIPLNDRDPLPIIYERGRAIYVPLCAVSDGAKAARNKKPDLIIQIFKKTSEA